MIDMKRTHYCSKCDAWTDHRDYAHDLRVCSCGNRFDGDNICRVSACQREEAPPQKGQVAVSKVITTHVQHLIRNALALAEAVNGEDTHALIHLPEEVHMGGQADVSQCLEKAAADLRHAAEELTAERLSCSGWQQV